MATSDKVLLGRQNMGWWDGISDKRFSQQSDVGGPLTITKMGNYVDVLTVYGDGTDYSDAAITKAMNRIGTTEIVGLVLTPGTWSINNDITITSNLTLWCPPGCILNIALDKTLTINGPCLLGIYQVFSGAGDVVWANGQDFWVEYWGAIADYNGTEVGTATDNATAFANTMSSVYAGGGGRVRFAGKAQHVWATGEIEAYGYYTTGSLLSMDTTAAGGMPDGSTITDSVDVKHVHLIGSGMDITAIIYGGSGSLINLQAAVGKLISHAKVKVLDMSLVGPGYENTSIGIDFNTSRVVFFNIFANLRIVQFEYGIYGDIGWENHFNNIYVEKCDNGVYLTGGEQTHFNQMYCGYNYTIALQIEGKNLNFTNLTCNYNETWTSGQIKIYDSEDIHINGLYTEFPASSGHDCVGILVDTAGNTRGNIKITNWRFHSGGATGDDKPDNLSIIKFTGGGSIAAFVLDGLGNLVTNANVTTNYYGIENDSGDPVTFYGGCQIRGIKTGGAANYDALFEPTTEIVNWETVPSDAGTSKLIRVNTILPFALTFTWTDMTDDSANDGDIVGFTATTRAKQVRIPWGASLVGISYSTSASAGTITLSDTNTGLSEVITPGDDDDGSFRYDIGDNELTYNQNFYPKATTADLGAATYDLIVTFFFALSMDDQDRIS